jgi:hypothetical protein
MPVIFPLENYAPRIIARNKALVQGAAEFRGVLIQGIARDINMASADRSSVMNVRSTVMHSLHIQYHRSLRYE